MSVSYIYVFHEAMNGCKTLKYSLKAYFENVNIKALSNKKSVFMKMFKPYFP